MRHDFLDRFSRLASPVHRAPAGFKFAAATCLIFLVIGLPRETWWGFGLVLIILLSIAVVSRIPSRFLLQRLLFFEPFIVGMAALNLLRPDGWPIFLGILTKSTLSLFAMILLANTTPFAQLLGVLRTIRVPGLMITLLALMYRYLFVLIDEGERMSRARRSRTYGSTHARRWRSAASVIVQLFIRSSERAERIYAAMAARGWQ